MKIRKAEKKDIREIIEIVTANTILNPKDKQNKELKKYIGFCIGSKRFLVLVAEDNGLLGLCICQLMGVRATDACLHDIYVSGKSKGVGSKIMELLYIELKKRDIKYLGLYSENNKKTLNFYKKQGFQIGRLIRRCDKKL